MSRLAVIATLYGERGRQNWPAIEDALAAQTLPPYELYVAHEGIAQCFFDSRPDRRLAGYELYCETETPRDANGGYAVIPYSHKINFALDQIQTDDDWIVTYLTDDSLPLPEKYERMVAALDEHPEWGAVYVGQRRNGNEHPATEVVPDAYCRLDHTQVAHRLTADRWPLDVSQITLGDAHFWRSLHASLGPFYPVPGPILDVVQQTPDGISGAR